jgi:hypothetical protein
VNLIKKSNVAAKKQPTKKRRTQFGAEVASPVRVRAKVPAKNAQHQSAGVVPKSNAVRQKMPESDHGRIGAVGVARRKNARVDMPGSSELGIAPSQQSSWIPALPRDTWLGPTGTRFFVYFYQFYTLLFIWNCEAPCETAMNQPIIFLLFFWVFWWGCQYGIMCLL